MKRSFLTAALLALPFGAMAQAIVPDPTITPGGVRTTDAFDVCSHGTGPAAPHEP